MIFNFFFFCPSICPIPYLIRTGENACAITNALPTWDHLGAERDLRNTHVCGTSSVLSCLPTKLPVLLFAVPVGSLDVSDRQKKKSGMVRAVFVHEIVPDASEAVLQS